MSATYVLPMRDEYTPDQSDVESVTGQAWTDARVLPGPFAEITFATALTDNQLSGLRALCNASDETSAFIVSRAQIALDLNNAYLLLDAPTAEQAIAQVGALTQLVSSLIRLAARQNGA